MFLQFFYWGLDQPCFYFVLCCHVLFWGHLRTYSYPKLIINNCIIAIKSMRESYFLFFPHFIHINDSLQKFHMFNNTFQFRCCNFRFLFITDLILHFGRCISLSLYFFSGFKLLLFSLFFLKIMLQFKTIFIASEI